MTGHDNRGLSIYTEISLDYVIRFMIDKFILLLELMVNIT